MLYLYVVLPLSSNCECAPNLSPLMPYLFAVLTLNPPNAVPVFAFCRAKIADTDTPRVLITYLYSVRHLPKC